MLTKTYGNGVTRTNVYDAVRRPTRLATVDAGGGLIVGFEHAYDRVDNKRHEYKLHDPGNSELYDYDSAYRLMRFDRGTLDPTRTSISAPSALPAVLNQQSWDLDGVGNWDVNEFTIAGTPQVLQTREDTSFNEIHTIRDDAGPVTALAHDDGGNQTDSGEVEYAWDALNRLRTVARKADGLPVAAYTYDCMNRRMRKSVTNSAALNGVTDFYYTGWRVVEEYAFDGVSESVTFQYVWGATYLDELIVRDARSGVTIGELNDGAGSDRQYQHANLLFSIFAVTDETAAVLERYQYDPYGNPTFLDPVFAVPTTSVIGQEYLFTGQRRDAETGLFYYKNRYYDVTQGRFVSRDPIGYAAGALGLYEYVGGAPIFYADPLGFDYWADVGATYKGMLWEGPKEMVGGMVHAVRHPIKTVQGIGEAAGYLYEDPRGTWEEVKRSAKESASTPGGQGKIVFDVLSAAVPGSKAGKLSKASKTCKPTRQFTVIKRSKKIAKEETRHAHGGKPKPTPRGLDKKQMKERTKEQNQPESHPDSPHPEKHFHRSDKQKHIENTGQNPHVTYPRKQ